MADEYKYLCCDGLNDSHAAIEHGILTCQVLLVKSVIPVNCYQLHIGIAFYNIGVVFFKHGCFMILVEKLKTKRCTMTIYLELLLFCSGQMSISKRSIEPKTVIRPTIRYNSPFVGLFVQHHSFLHLVLT